MNVAVLVLSSVLAAGPSGDGPTDRDRAQIRCRPAPYYVADRGERPKLERALITGTRVPVRGTGRRVARPCHLMDAPAPVIIQPSSSGVMRVAY